MTKSMTSELGALKPAVQSVSPPIQHKEKNGVPSKLRHSLHAAVLHLFLLQAALP